MPDVQKVARLLGGRRVLERRVRTAMDLHEVLERGLPLQSLEFFAENRRHIPADVALAFVLGRRRKAHPSLPVRLGRHQTDRLFVLADAVANAADAFGSMRKAERWLTSPVALPDMGGRRPMDLLSTPIGEQIFADKIDEVDLVMRIERMAELRMEDIVECRYTEFRNRDELRAFIERISRRVARRHRAKSGSKRKDI